MRAFSSNPILSRKGQPHVNPSDPGGPNYIGSVDYPHTVYNGYIGSFPYVYEPRAIGFLEIDSSKATIPVAKMPESANYNKLNMRSSVDPVFEECSIPSFFQKSEDKVRTCNLKFSMFIFKAIFLFNFFFLLLLYKKWTVLTIGLFVAFHIGLYYVLTVIYIRIKVGEWNMIMRYRKSIKKNDEYTPSDGILKQFENINDFIKQQSINSTRFLEFILAGSLIFVWIPLFFENTSK